jgi:N-succinyldiaminopimelate aminotransferase
VEENKLVSEKLALFGVTIFSEMTKIAQEKGAINLAQGFPDFDGPEEILEAAVEAIRGGHNQYPRSMGFPGLVQSVAQKIMDHYKLSYDPYTEIIVCSGATECMASAFIGLTNPGDEVIIFEPFYDSYPVYAAMTGAIPRYYTLRFPDFNVDMVELEKCFTGNTRLLILNTPHNPTGKVFTRTELEGISELCKKYDVVVLTDEVYEHLTYDGASHIPISALPGMRGRTLSISGIGKTFSLTGWRIGWITGPAGLIRAVQKAHQYLAFAPASPLQAGVASVLGKFDDDYYTQLRVEYTKRRNILLEALKNSGFIAAVPRGAYYILADFTNLWKDDDRSFVLHLIEQCSVAAIPPSVFYSRNPEEGMRLVRFAFCKQLSTLEKAAEQLKRIH